LIQLRIKNYEITFIMRIIIDNEYKIPLSQIARRASISIERTIKNEYKYAVGVSYP